MKRKITRIYLMCTVLLSAFFIVGCSGMKDDINDLQKRVDNIESTVGKLEEAIKNGKLITEFNSVKHPTSGVDGWIMKFSDGKDITIYNGEKGKTPYAWINVRGNWAVNLDVKPADSDNAKYEILGTNNSPVKANGLSMRAINQNGFVAFEQYDIITGNIISTQPTNFPFNGGKIITTIVDDNTKVTFTIDTKTYEVAKAIPFPTSITMLRGVDYVFKGDSIKMGVVINPATAIRYTKEDISLQYVPSYIASRGYGSNPNFIKISSFEPTDIAGEYTLTLSWNKSDEAFAKNSPIFIALTFTDVKGDKSTIVSSTPVILNEKFKSIVLDNIVALPDVVMFSDETYTDSLYLKDYHQDYVNTIAYTLNAPNILNPFTRYNVNQGTDKFKFSITSDNTLWTAGQKVVTTPVTATITDFGLSAIPKEDARPDLGIPEKPAIPAVAPISVNKLFNVTVYLVEKENVLDTVNWGERWLPNSDARYSYNQNIGQILTIAGYDPAKWTFEITGYKYQLNKGTIENALPSTITADMIDFTATNKVVKFFVTPQVNYGTHVIKVLFKATSVTPRHRTLSSTRNFEVAFKFTLVPPRFEIKLKNDVNILNNVNNNVYQTYKIADININSLFDVNSNTNVSLASDINPNSAPLSYRYDATEVQGAQGIKFTPYPAIKQPEANFTTNHNVDVNLFVKLETGQSIPVTIVRPDNSNKINNAGQFIVSYMRSNLDHVDATNAVFAGNYDAMITTGVSLGANANFSPMSATNVVIDPTQIKSIAYSAKGTVYCLNGAIPNGLSGLQILKINSSTGVVNSDPKYTWSDQTLILAQLFTVTYTDIWGNSKSKDVEVKVKSNSIP